jgi:hypothetical protein
MYKTSKRVELVQISIVSTCVSNAFRMQQLFLIITNLGLAFSPRRAQPSPLYLGLRLDQSYLPI